MALMPFYSQDTQTVEAKFRIISRDDQRQDMQSEGVSASNQLSMLTFPEPRLRIR